MGFTTLNPSLVVALGGRPPAPAFCEAAQQMPPLSQQLLLLNEEPMNVPPAALLDEVGLPMDMREATERASMSGEREVLQKPGVLPAVACAALRAAVDANRQEKVDSVDGAPDHQLNIGHDRLRALVGAPAAARLWALVPELLAGGGGVPRLEQAEIFIRRYSPDTRPWNPFHTDSAALTINVALSDDAACQGGHLLALYDGRVRRVSRRQGDATVHSSRLLHAVSALRTGRRYSLIIFVGRSQLPPRTQWCSTRTLSYPPCTMLETQRFCRRPDRQARAPTAHSDLFKPCDVGKKKIIDG